jgi:hypothetical protein
MASKNGSREALGSIPLQLNPVLENFYSLAVVTEIGDGSNTIFGEDRWIACQQIRDIAPTIVNMVPNKCIKTKTVNDALQNGSWSMIFEVK